LLIEITREKVIVMLSNILQMGMNPLGEYEELILSAILIVVDIFLLKLGLIITKAEYRTKIKWVAISFVMQFGTIFFISSPMLILGFTGAFHEGPPVGAIILAIVGSIFLDLNLINVIHKIGLTRSFIVTIIILIPIIFAMSFLIPYLSKL
jgi:hypothetical protein